MAGLSRYSGRFNLSSLALRRIEYLPRTVHCYSTSVLSIQSRWSSNSSRRSTATPEQLTYDETLAIRTDQARRSVLILEPNSSTSEHLYEFCRKHGPINRAFSFQKSTSKYTLVEYRNTPSVAKLLENTQHFSNSRRIPIETRFLCLCLDRGHVDRRRGKITAHSDNTTVHVDNFGSCRLTNDDLRDCKTVFEQISLLYGGLSMSELEIRLRYFLCSEVEALVRRVIRGADVRLFGSCVSGLGRFDSDIDMVLDISRSTRPQLGSDRTSGCMSYYMTKMKPESGDRVFTQRALSAVGGLLDAFMPQVVNVRRILRARVPIIKFHHGSTALECDLSLNNVDALDMGRLIHHVTSLDSRVAPLIFTVRQWAKVNSVTLPNPGPCLSNFMLTLLVMYYLQTKSLLPAFRNLCTGQPGSRVVLSSDVALPREISRARQQSGYTITLDKLLIDFFTFYASFDFSQVSLSLVEGHALPRSSEPIPVIKEQNQEQENQEQEETVVVQPPAVLYIENPLDRSLNVSKNVDSTHLKKFQEQCAMAASSLKASPSREAPWWGDAWGLLTVLNLDPMETQDVVHVDDGEVEILTQDIESMQENNQHNKPETSKRNSEMLDSDNINHDLDLKDASNHRTADLKLRKNSSSVRQNGLQEPKLNVNIRTLFLDEDTEKNVENDTVNPRKDLQH